MFFLHIRLCSTALTRFGVCNGKGMFLIGPGDTAFLNEFDGVGFICESHEAESFAVNSFFGFLGYYKGVLDRGNGGEEGREFRRSRC